MEVYIKMEVDTAHVKQEDNEESVIRTEELPSEIKAEKDEDSVIGTGVLPSEIKTEELDLINDCFHPMKSELNPGLKTAQECILLISKKKRNTISLDVKIQILDSLQKGESFASLAKTYKLNESTVRTIKKNEITVRRSVTSGSLISSKYTSYVRDPIMEKMEKALMIWIEDHTQKRISIDTNAIKEKSKRIYKFLTENDQSISSEEKKHDFTASKGWLEKFKRRYSLHNLKIKGEAASADENAAKLFLPQLLKIINENCYSPHQVFNAGETGLFWKKMPSKTFIAKTEKTASGFKASKDRVTLMFCGNASGDSMMKPLLINRALKPRAMKGVNMKNLPVHWMSNKNAWMNASIFTQWFNECFIPEVESYLKKKNLPFKVLLLLDNAPGHPQNIHHPNITIQFLPPNTTSLIQPLDQGVISIFKACYIKRSYEEILNKIDSNASLTIIEAWKNFTILNCVKYIGLAIKEIKASTLNACWRAVWPEVVEPNHTIPTRNETFNDILNVTKALGQGFENLEFSDIDELFIDQEIDEEELIYMVSRNEQGNIKSSNDSDIANKPNKFTCKDISEILQLASNLENKVLATDPVIDRAVKFQRDLKSLCAQYSEIYKDLKKKNTQKLVTDYLIRREEEPSAGFESDNSSDFEPTKKKKLVELEYSSKEAE